MNNPGLIRGQRWLARKKDHTPGDARAGMVDEIVIHQVSPNGACFKNSYERNGGEAGITHWRVTADYDWLDKLSEGERE